jgi:hypothetical protein
MMTRPHFPESRESESAKRLPVVGFLVSILCGVLVALSGCENRDGGPVDTMGSPPFVRSATVAPDQIPVTALTTTNGVDYVATVQVTAIVKNPSGSGTIGSVQANVTPPDGSAPIGSFLLRQQGSSGGNLTYAGQVQFTVSKSALGAFLVEVSAFDQHGFEGNAVAQTVTIVGKNYPPVLSNLVAPDTVLLPVSGTISIPLHVTVSDSNGLGDIRDVFFRSLDSSNPTLKIFLFDDGSPANGDLVAHDGMYSRIIILDSSNDRKTYRFAFQAIDASGDTSATILHFLTVK